MARGNLAVIFGALVAGAIVIDYGVKNARGAISNATTATPAAGSGSVTTGTPVSTKGFPAAVDPLPDSVGSRLDQGIDATGKTFLSPWSGTVVRADAKNSGWRGGGYIAVQSTDDPSKVAYFAEGITPIVKLGQAVTAGQRIGLPVSNPYNGIVGNIEFGPANPSSPGQPLAQVTSNARQMVLDFYGWLESVGGPKATSTSNAGAA